MDENRTRVISFFLSSLVVESDAMAYLLVVYLVSLVMRSTHEVDNVPSYLFWIKTSFSMSTIEDSIARCKRK
jgi:hypothetical protein